MAAMPGSRRWWLTGANDGSGKPTSQVTRLQDELLAWYAESHRDLPWRRTRNPWAIWVSEIMLQQTTVAAVAPRFERFMLEFPTLADLAAADEADVLRLWEGLGYYRRARHLHRAARQLQAASNGCLPDAPETWAALPGVGRYILGAVLSQAFNRRLPVIEVNTIRVLCRLYGQSGDPRRSAVQHWLWETAERLLPRRRCGDFNQALMELGALICTPATPKCQTCPMALHCTARRRGLQEAIPVRTRAEKVTEVREAAIVVWKRGRVLIAKRPERGRWASLWEFPRGEVQRNEELSQAANRLLWDLTGLQAVMQNHLLTVRHTIMQRRVRLECFEAKYREGTFRSSSYAEGRWIKPAQIAEFPVSSPQRRIAQALLARTGPPI